MIGVSSWLLLSLLATGGPARAEEATVYDRLDARGFWVADTSGDPWRPLRLAYPAAGTGWDAGVLVDVARNPLVEALPEGDQPLVDQLSSAHAFGGFAWRGMRFEGSMPVTLYGHDPGGGFAGTGDLRLGGLFPAWEPRETWPGLGLQASVWLPTGTAQRWSGSAGVAAGAVACLAQELGPVGWTLNAGLRVARSTEARNVDAGGGPVGGAEVHWRVTDRLAMGGGLAVQGATGFSSWPLEGTGRLRYRTDGGGFVTVGYAHGIGDGVGSSGGRLFFGVGYGARPPFAPPPAITVPIVLTRREVLQTVQEDGPMAVLVDDRIVVSEQVFFREAQAVLLAESDAVLEAVVDVLEQHPDIEHLLVEGHTNSRGSLRYNRRLSDARAQAVVDWLVAAGVEPDRLLAVGLGEEHPLVGDDHPDAMVVNRRVEFKILRSDESGVTPSVPSRDELPQAVRADR